jgi:hypothetical protein
MVSGQQTTNRKLQDLAAGPPLRTWPDSELAPDWRSMPEVGEILRALMPEVQ